MLQYNTFGGFTPAMDEPTLSQIIKNYSARPRAFSKDDVSLIRQHAQYYNIPFAEDEQTWADHVGGVIRQAVTGYISGFTTLNIGGRPQTPAESIARAVGSVAGFAGYLPGAPISAIGKATNLAGLQRLGQGLTAARGHSIPLMLAEGIMKKGNSIFNAAVANQAISGAGAVKSAVDFLKNPAVNNYIQRGLRLGLASGVSSWQGGIDQMMKSFLWGGAAGAIDASIGNLIRMNDKTSEMALKGLAGAMADGLPSTLRGDTTPEQVYYYLRGAYFGAQEMPWYKRYAQTKMLDWQKSGKSPEDYIKETNMPKAAVKDFLDYTERSIVNDQTLAAFQDVFVNKKFTEGYNKALGEFESSRQGIASKVAGETEQAATKNSPADTAGGDSGQGVPEPFVPPHKLISNMVKYDMAPLFKGVEGNSFDATMKALQDISAWHTVLSKEQLDTPNKNHYTKEMMTQLKKVYYPNEAMPKEVYRKLRRIQTSFELSAPKRYFRAVFDDNKEDGKSGYRFAVTDEENKKTPNGKILYEPVSRNSYGNREIWLDNLYAVDSSKGFCEEIPAIDVAGMLRNPPEEMSKKQTDNVRMLKAAIKSAGDQGYYWFGGNNAKTAMSFMPFHDAISKMNQNQIDSTFNQYISLIASSKKYNPAGVSVDEVRKAVIDEIGADKLYDPIVGRKIWVSNVLYEVQNQMGFATGYNDVYDYFSKFASSDLDIVSNVKAWTKRNQLFYDPGVPLQKEWLMDKFFVDPANFEKFNRFENSRILIIEDAKGKFSQLVDGKAEEYEGSTDGAIIPLRELMRGTEIGYGFEDGAGEIKASATGRAGDPNGVMIIKSAWHSAVPDHIYDRMKSMGITHLVFRTAAKHIGRNKSATIDEFLSSDVSDRVVDLPWNSWKINTGKHFTDSHTYGRHAVPTQTLNWVTSLLLDGDELKMADSARENMLSILKTKNFSGDPEANDMVTRFLNTTNIVKRQGYHNSILESLDSIGKDQINKLLQDKRAGSIAPELLVRILDSNKKALMEDLEDNTISEAEYNSAMAAAAKDSSNLEYYLTLMQDNPESVMNNPLVRRLADKAVSNFLKRGITHPKTGDSGDFVIAPYIAQFWRNHPYMSKLNDNKNIFMLGQDAADKFMLTHSNGRKESLGKIWARVESVGRQNADSEDLELLRFVVTRTPQGSPSGAIVLEFAGFDGSQGHRLYVHPIIANMLGGADYDIDTAKVLGGNAKLVNGKVTGDGVTKEFKDAVKLYERYAYEEVADASQQVAPQVAMIISGGQTGIDRMGLEVAKKLGYKTGGTAEYGYDTERGPDLSLRDFGLGTTIWGQQASDKPGKWLARTELNVKNSDITVYFSEKGEDSPGYVATKRYANMHNKPFLLNPTADQLRRALASSGAKIMNVAGNRASKMSKEFAARAEKILTDALSSVEQPATQAAPQAVEQKQKNTYRVWHGSDAEITSFLKINPEGFFAKTKGGDPRAIFFSATRAPSGTVYGDRKYQQEFDVTMNNPLVVDGKKGYSRDSESFKELVDRAIAGGYDGVIVKNIHDNFDTDIYISLDASKVARPSKQQVAPTRQRRLVDPKHSTDDVRGGRFSDIYEAGGADAAAKLKTPFLMFNRTLREQVSVANAEGRGHLGQVANSEVYLNELGHILKKNGGKYEMEENIKGDKFKLTYTLRSQAELDNAVKAAAAALNMSADITEFNGLIPAREILYDIYSRAVKLTIEPIGKVKSTPKPEDVLVRSGLIGRLSKVKGLMYSKNYEQKRNYTDAEVTTGLKYFGDIYDNDESTLLGMARNILVDFQTYSPTIHSGNASMFEKMYADYEKSPAQKYWSVRMAAMPVKKQPGTTVDMFFKKKLYDPLERTRVVEDKSEVFWSKDALEIVIRGNKELRGIFTSDEELVKWATSKKISKETIEKMKRENKTKLANMLSNRYYRTQLVNETMRLGEQWALNDIYDMVSAKMIDKYHEAVPKHLQSQLQRRVIAPAQELLKKKAELSGLSGEDEVTAADRGIALDQRYKSIRESLSTNAEKDFLDIYLLSSWKRGVKGTKDVRGNEDPNSPKRYGPEGSKTRYSYDSDLDQIALDLRSMNPDLPREFFNEYESLILGEKTIGDITRVLTDQELKDIESKSRERLILKTMSDIESGKILGKIIEDTRDVRVENLVDYFIPLKPNPKILKKLRKDPVAYQKFETEYLPEYQKLKGYLDKAVGPDLLIQNQLVRGMTSKWVDRMLGKDLSSLSLEDVRMLNRSFEYINTPTIGNRLFGGKEPATPMLKKVFYYQFPSELHREQLRIAFQIRQEEGYFVNRFGQTFKGQVLVPASGIENVQSTIYISQEMAAKRKEEYKKEYKIKIAPIRVTEFGEDLEQIAIHFQEDDAIIRDIESSGLPTSVKQKKIQNYKDGRQAAVIRYREILKKAPLITVKLRGANGEDDIRSMTPADVVRYMRNVMTELSTKAYNEIIRANDEKILEYAKRDKNGNVMYHWYGGKNKRPSSIPIIDETKFLHDMQDALQTNREWPMEFGIDGLRKISHSILHSNTYMPKGHIITDSEAEISNRSLEYGEKNSTTGRLRHEMHFPHMLTDEVSFRKDIAETIRAIEDDPNMPKESKERFIKKHVGDYIKHGGLIEDELPIDMFHRNSEIISDEISKYATKKERDAETLRYLKASSISGNQMSREYYSETYERSFDAYDKYFDRLIDTYYRNFSQLLSRIQIKKATSDIKKVHGDETSQVWNKFMHLYAQGAAGYGVIIPKTYSEDPRMKIKGTLYNAYSDTQVLNRLNQIATSLGLGKDKREMFGISEVFQQRDISNWSALEAKYSLATLLARPKSMAANLMGGSLNTAVYAGFGNLIKAQNINELKKIHPEFESIAEWKQFIMEKGIVEDMMVNELNQSRYANHKGIKKAISKAFAKLSKDPSMDDKTMIQIFKEEGVSEYVFNKAAWFMRTAERKLREDAFLATYIQQVENFSPAIANGSAHSMLKFDSPILIEMAKRGVKATQYLYSAPFRPMFSTSALGKIMTRFQMYAYNSVDFRRETVNRAALYGFKPGTVEFNRFKRFIVADMLSMAAATAFTYSIFDSNLPAPWSWVQDFGDYLFGEEKERERAFFGTYPGGFAPLQIITPPSLRIIGPTITGMVENDFSKLANYTIWTMFPFGPLAMDIKRTIDNPSMVIERMTGFPMRGAATEIITKRNHITGKKIEEKKAPNATQQGQQRGLNEQVYVP